jgi:2-hydroxychromene-2-carboxylate isomerase
MKTYRRWHDTEHDTKARMMEHMALSWLRENGMSEAARLRFGSRSFPTEVARNAAEMIFTFGLDDPGAVGSHMELYDYTAADLEAAFAEALKLDEDDVIARQLMYMGVVSAEELAIHGKAILLQAR